MRATAPKALLRAFQNSARSASSRATRTRPAPCSAPTRSTTAVWEATSAGVPSTSTSSIAAASTGRSAWTNASTATVISRSIISIAAGITPAAMIAPTASPAALTVGKSSSMVRTSGGLRISRTVTSVTTPSVPSPPTTKPRRS